MIVNSGQIWNLIFYTEVHRLERQAEFRHKAERNNFWIIELLVFKTQYGRVACRLGG